MADKKKPLMTFWVHLKNGSVLKFRAREFTVQHRGGSLTSYEHKGSPYRHLGVPQRVPLFVDANEVIAVEQKQGWFKWR